MLHSIRKRTLVISELEGIWKEALTYNFDMICNFPEVTAENCETPQ
jgi:hypothetical protein